VILQAFEMLADIAERDVPLAPLTTYRVGGSAALLVRPRSEDDLARIAQTSQHTGLPMLVVGNGSNLLVADSGFAGIAISLSGFATEIEISATLAKVGAAVLLPRLARRLAAAALTGFEWAVGVPGSVGGAVRMNAGGHGSDIAASLVSARVFELATGVFAEMPADTLGLRFRGSDLTDHQVVVQAQLRLTPGDPEQFGGAASTSRAAKTPGPCSSIQYPASCQPEN
jgi:UDP-N-acetylmuramate dehydrogenase